MSLFSIDDGGNRFLLNVSKFRPD